MIEGKCHKCGTHYHGWGLKTQRNRVCFICGTGLEVKMKERNLVYHWFSSQEVEEYKVDVYKEEWGNLRDKNLLAYLTLN